MAAMTPSTTISAIVFIMSSLVHSLLGRSVEAPVFEFFDDGVQVEGHADARARPVVHADGVREPAGEQHALPGGGREGNALAGVVQLGHGIAQVRREHCRQTAARIKQEEITAALAVGRNVPHIHVVHTRPERAGVRVHRIATSLALHVRPGLDDLPAGMLAGHLWRAFGELRGLGGDFEDRDHRVLESGAGPPEHGHVVRRGPADDLVVCLGGVGGLALENRPAQLLVGALVERDGEDQQRGGEDRPDADFHLLGHDDSPRADSTENIVRSTWCQVSPYHPWTPTAAVDPLARRGFSRSPSSTYHSGYACVVLTCEQPRRPSVSTASPRPPWGTRAS